MTSPTSEGSKRLRRIVRVSRFATLAILVGMFVGTHLPSEVSPVQDYMDKVAHFSAYMLLSFSAMVSVAMSTDPLRPGHYFYVWLMLILYGAFDETTQLFVGRSCDFADWVCDVLGVLAGMMLFRYGKLIIRALSSSAKAKR